MTRPIPPGRLPPPVFFLLVLAVALAIRLVHLLVFAQATPFFDPAPWNTPMNPLDPGEYDRWGMQINGGDWWWTDHGQGHYFQSPVYPYFVAFLYFILGGRSVLGVVVVQAILGAVTCALIATMARRFLSPLAGWTAAALGALYAPAIFYESFLLKESLATFLVALALAVTLAEFSSRRGPPVSRWPAWIGAGLLWGAALATWPLLAPLALVAAGWAAWRLPGTRLTAAGLILCGIFVAVLPCTVRNVVGEQRFVLISDAGNRNWAVGNSTNSSGTYVDHPGEPLTPGAPSYWALLLRKLQLFFRGAEIPQVTDFALLRHASPVLRWPLPLFGLVAPLALLGFVVTLPRWRQLLPLHAVALVYPLLVSLFFVVGRFRLPVMPAFIFLAAAAIDAMVRAGREAVAGLAAPAAASPAGTGEKGGRISNGLPGKPATRLLAMAAVALLYATMLNTGRSLPRGSYPFHHAYAHYWVEMGEVAVTNGRPEDALADYERVLDVPSRHYRGVAHTGRARVYLESLGLPQRAVEELRASLQVDPGQQGADETRDLIRRLEGLAD